MIGQAVSHYQILEYLGGGGMGVVYKAEDTRLKRTVALKFLPPELTRDPEAKQRFIHEARAASALDHPNICNVHDIGETDDGQMFIVMACYEGESLKKRIERGPLPVGDTVDIAIQIVKGLANAHEHGIVHRDIKPANILVTRDGTVKIVDFGIVKLTGTAMLSKTGSTVGTVAYMSPEQARGDVVDHRTDLWSLGVVIYELLTGRLPFRGEHEQALIYSILNEDPKPLESLPGDSSVGLDLAVKKMLQKDPDCRPQEATDALAGLMSVKEKLEAVRKQDSAAADEPQPSIAVLPFVNMTADPDNEYFSDGLAEELINALSQLDGLHVTARTSAFRFRGKDVDIREIGNQLNVSTVLEGSVRKAGTRLRITAQLINVADGFHLWSEKYDREVEDIFAIQDEISSAIVGKLKVRLFGEERARLARHYTDNFEVYDLYLKGRYFLSTLTVEGITKSLGYFQHAIQIDRSFALAHTGMAAVYYVHAVLALVPSVEAMPKAQSHLLKALELDASLAEAHAWLGEVNLVYNWDWTAAEKNLGRAIELKPNSLEAHQFYADYLIATGRLDEALTEVERARDLDPLSTLPDSIVAYHLFVSRRFERVIEHCRKMLSTEPSFLLQIHLWRALHQQNLLHEAFLEAKKLFMVFISCEVADVMESVYAESGYAAAMRAAAQKLAELSTQRYVSPYLIATLFSQAEDDDETLRWLEQAYEERDQRIYITWIDPGWDRVRSFPRFTALVKKVGPKK